MRRVAPRRRGRGGGPTLAALILAVQGLTLPPQYEVVEVGSVVVHARPEHMSLGIALAEYAERPWTWPGLVPEERAGFQLVVAPHRTAFRRLSRGRVPEWGVGLVLPGPRLIAIRADAPDPFGALRHELAHLALHDAIPGRVPLWFDEGYAVVAAGEWGRMAALQLNLAVVRGGVTDLRGLDAALRLGSGEAETAYALAGAAVALLARLNPSGTLTPLLGRLREGAPFGDAVLTTTGYTVDQFDNAWRRDIRRRFGWFVWLGAGGMWALVIIAVVFAAAARRRRDRPRRAALDQGWVVPEEESAEGPEIDQLDQEPSRG